MTFPTFLVIGAMKAGTTSLHAQFAMHPDVFMSEPKELHFFAQGKNWERGHDWYEAHFSTAAAAIARGETSPSYSQADIFPGVAERIADVMPDVKLVYLVRNPIERMQSMYLHQRANGRETRSIAQAFETQPYYLNASRYSWQLEHYLGCFPASQIKVVTTDALRDDPFETMASLFEFLGVNPEGVAITPLRRGQTDEKRVKRSFTPRLATLPGYRRAVSLAPDPVRRAARRLTTRPAESSMAAIPAMLEGELIEQLRPDIAGLRRFLGDDFDGWGMLTTD